MKNIIMENTFIRPSNNNFFLREKSEIVLLREALCIKKFSPVCLAAVFICKENRKEKSLFSLWMALSACQGRL